MDQRDSRDAWWWRRFAGRVRPNGKNPSEEISGRPCYKILPINHAVSGTARRIFPTKINNLGDLMD
jgi:hypothetical protein